MRLSPRKCVACLALASALAAPAAAQAPDDEAPLKDAPAPDRSDDKDAAERDAKGAAERDAEGDDKGAPPPEKDAPAADAPADGAPTDETAAPDKSSPAIALPKPPPLPTDAELKALADADPRFARPILRRAARTSTSARQRSFALRVLGARDPSRATARICARALRVDPAAGVRRSAAECLGRLPERFSAPQTPAMVSALKDGNLDVVTMAGWALANVGEAEALGPLTALVRHEDPRVGRHFYTYATRLRTRHGLDYVVDGTERAADDDAIRLVPPAGTVVSQIPGLELTASTAWVGIYGGMVGWLHGGLFTAAYGGPGLQDLSALAAMGGAVAGLAAGGSYAFFRADKLHLAHNVVQLGTMGTVLGYGAGLLSGVPPVSGLNASSLSIVGTAVGTGVGVLLNETQPPTAGALTTGLAVGFGAALSTGAVAGGYNLPFQTAVGMAMFAGGASGGLTTVLMAPYEVGMMPAVGATVGGISGGALMGVVLGLAESFQLADDTIPFTEGAGYAIAGGYAAGAVVGGTLTLLIPDDYDPLLAGKLQLDPPTVGVIPDFKNPGQTAPVALLGGRF